MSIEVQDHFVLMLGLAHDMHFLKAKFTNPYLLSSSIQKVGLISLRLSGFLFSFFPFFFCSFFFILFFYFLKAKPRNPAHRSIGV